MKFSPIHVHVQKENMIYKLWLDPVVLCNKYGIAPIELNRSCTGYQSRIQCRYRENRDLFFLTPQTFSNQLFYRIGNMYGFIHFNRLMKKLLIISNSS